MTLTGQETRKVHVYKVHFHAGEKYAVCGAFEGLLGPGQASIQPENVTCRRCKASPLFIAAKRVTP